MRDEATAPNKTATAISVLLAAWVLDYRAAEDDRIAPLIQAAGVALTLLALVVYLSRPLALPARVRSALTIVLGFVGYALVVGTLRGQPLGAAFKAAIPLLLFAAALAMTFSALQQESATRVRSLILTFALISALLKPVTWYFGSADVELSEVRYQILSGSLLLLIAHCIVAFAARFGWRDGVVLVTVGALIAASVTRTYVLVAAILVAIHLVLAPRVLARVRSLGAVVGVVAVIGLFVIFGDVSLSEIVERWQARVAYSDDLGFDLTAASRIAEADFQISSLQRSVTDALVGNGIAARTELAGEYADLFYAVAPNHEVSSIGFGHTDQTSILFVGGVVVGGLFLLFTIRLVVWGLAMIRKALPAIDARRGDAFVACWGATTVIGVTVYGVFGGALADRSASLHYGVAAGMLLWAMEQSTWLAQKTA